MGVWVCRHVSEVGFRTHGWGRMRDEWSGKRFYEEVTVPFKGDPLLTAARIVQTADRGDYVLYEHQGEWSLGLGVHGRLTVYPDRTVVTQDEREHIIEPSDDLSRSIHAGLRELRVEGWRAYGTAAFELARVHYGLPVSGSPPLVTLFVPAEEVRIGRGSILVRALDRAVAGRRTGGSFLKLPPYPPLERRPAESSGQIEAWRGRAYG